MVFDFALEDAAREIAASLKDSPAFATLDDAARETAVLSLIQLDLRFMEDTGVDKGQPYDEDAGFAFLERGLKRVFPALNASDAADAFTDAWDTFLEDHGALEWE